MVKVDWSGTEECRQKAEFETTLLLGITSSTRSLSQALNKYFLVEQLESSESCIARCLVRTPQQLFLSWKRTQVRSTLVTHVRQYTICAKHHG